MKTEIGRLPAEEIEKGIVFDSPEKTVQAILTKLDELIDAVKALDAANTGVPEVAALKKLVLKL